MTTVLPVISKKNNFTTARKSNKKIQGFEGASYDQNLTSSLPAKQRWKKEILKKRNLTNNSIYFASIVWQRINGLFQRFPILKACEWAGMMLIQQPVFGINNLDPNERIRKFKKQLKKLHIHGPKRCILSSPQIPHIERFQISTVIEKISIEEQEAKRFRISVWKSRKFASEVWDGTSPLLCVLSKLHVFNWAVDNWNPKNIYNQ